MTLIHAAAVVALMLVIALLVGRCSVESLPDNCDGHGHGTSYTVNCWYYDDGWGE